MNALAYCGRIIAAHAARRCRHTGLNTQLARSLTTISCDLCGCTAACTRARWRKTFNDRAASLDRSHVAA